MLYDPVSTSPTFSEMLGRFDEVAPEGNAFIALCPAHNDSTPSLRLAYTEDRKVMVKCRAGCPLEYVLAAVSLPKSSLFDVEPGDLTGVRPLTRTTAALGPRERAPLRAYLDRTEEALSDSGDDALSYAARRFGMTPELASELGLGYDDGTLNAGAVILSRRKFRNAPRLVVPFLDFEGVAHGFQGRALTPAEPKWSGPNNPEGATWGRYGVLRAGTDRAEVLLTEGPGDGLTAVAAGYDAVIVPGASRGTSPGLADDLAAGLTGRSVVVVGDRDDAGERFAREITAALRTRGVDAHRLTIPTEANDLAAWHEAASDAFPAALAVAVAVAATAEEVSEESSDDTDDEQKPADGEPGVSRSAIVGYARREYRFFRSENGQPYAVKRKGARTAMDIGDKLKRDIMYGYSEDRQRRTGKLAIVRDEMMRSVMQYLIAEAERSDDVMDVALRAAMVDDGRRVVVDLGDATGQVVEITAEGWNVREPRDNDPLFRRTRPTLPLPNPVRGGSLDVLRELLGFGSEEARWLLVRGWLSAAFFADHARPLLWLTGSHGSGKTTRAKMILNLINPAENLSKEPGKKEWDDSTQAMSRYVVAYDNLTTISQSVSDWLCRLVTGVTEDRRVLYSQDEVHTVSYKRSGIVTSITMPPGLASDALERISAVHLDRIPDGGRRSEEMILAAYEAARPELLGAVLDDVVRVLANMDKVRADQTRNWPRMADFGMALAALDEGLGLRPDGGHLAAYTGTLHDEMAERALDDEFTLAVLGVVKKRASGEWRGTGTELLAALDEVAGWDWGQNRRPDWWPSSPRKLKDQLKRHAETLRHAGVEFTEPPRTTAGRHLVLRRIGDLAAVPDEDAGSAPGVVVSMPRR